MSFRDTMSVAESEIFKAVYYIERQNGAWDLAARSVAKATMLAFCAKMEAAEEAGAIEEQLFHLIALELEVHAGIVVAVSEHRAMQETWRPVHEATTTARLKIGNAAMCIELQTGAAKDRARSVADDVIRAFLAKVMAAKEADATKEQLFSLIARETAVYTDKAIAMLHSPTSVITYVGIVKVCNEPTSAYYCDKYSYTRWKEPWHRGIGETMTEAELLKEAIDLAVHSVVTRSVSYKTGKNSYLSISDPTPIEHCIIFTQTKVPDELKGEYEVPVSYKVDDHTTSNLYHNLDIWDTVPNAMVRWRKEKTAARQKKIRDTQSVAESASDYSSTAAKLIADLNDPTRKDHHAALASMAYINAAHNADVAAELAADVENRPIASTTAADAVNPWVNHTPVTPATASNKQNCVIS